MPRTRMTEKQWRRSHHSAPGDPPFVQTGTLRRSITFTIAGLKLLIGSSLKPQGGSPSYAWCLENGTTKMAPRPYLRPAVAKNRKTILRMLLGKA